MNPAKAIELSEIYARHPLNNMTPDEKTAHQLGIEALKRIKEIRPFGNNPGIYNLPGEDGFIDQVISQEEKKRLRESPLGTIY